MPVVVGVDPGGRYTGVVTRMNEALVSVAVVTRPAGHDMADHHLLAEWIEIVVGRVACELDDAGPLAEVVDVRGGDVPPGVLLGVEGLKRPSPHVRRADGNSLTNPDGIIATAALFGAIVARWPDAVVVPPAKNGGHPPFAYPERIRPGARLGGPSEHARSAWDVAGSVPLLSRLTPRQEDMPMPIRSSRRAHG